MKNYICAAPTPCLTPEFLDRRWPTWVRGIVIAGITASLAGCQSHFYDTTLAHLDYSGKERQASIQVSDPQLYKREHLINERREELDYLADLLTKSRNVDFAPELARDIETISSLSAQLGLSFDAGAKRQYGQQSQLADLENQIAVTKLQGQLSQVRRDLQLLQAHLDSQTAPSSSLGTSTTASNLPKVPPPGLGDAKEIANRLEAMVKGLTDRLDKQSTGPRVVTAAGVSPRDLFQDRQAYRRDIQSAINATRLDSLHDISANSLFRMQFRATILPGEADRELGVLQMQLRRPTFVLPKGLSPPELDSLYFEWLEHVTYRLNGIIGGNAVRPDPTTLHLGVIGKVFRMLTITVPKNVGLIKPVSAPVAALGARVAAARAKPAPANPVVAEKCSLEVYIDESLPPVDCYVVRIAVPLEFPVHTASRIVRASRGGSDSVASLGYVYNKLNKRDFDPLQCASLPRDEAFAKGLGLASTFVAEQETLARLQQALGATMEQINLLSANAVLQLALISQNITHLLDISTAVEGLNATRCNVPRTQPIEPKYAVPGEFISALFSEKASGSDRILTARGRVSTYAVSPVALAQRVSTAARAADAIQIAASLAASLPTQGLGLSSGLGYLRSVTGKADALERVPLVVGYSASTTDLSDTENGTSFGWLLGPKVVLDTEKKALALEHNLAPYDLAADISLPGWWPAIEIKVDAAWAPNWRADRNEIIANAKGGRTIRVPMRHSQGDLDGITTLVASGVLRNDGVIYQRIQFASIGLIEPRSVSLCASSVTFIVRGSNIWRAQAAYLLGQEGKNISVLPDMAGVSVSFDISGLGQQPPPTEPAKLLIATPDGLASADVVVQGIRSACGKEQPAQEPKDEGGLVVASILPATLYACDTKLRMIVRGRDLKDIDSVYLGTIPGSHRNPAEDAKSVEVQFEGPIGSKGGTQSSLPLIVRTTKGGVASKDVAIERDDCKHPGRTPLSLYAPPGGNLDLCAKDSRLVISGEGATRIDAARLVADGLKINLGGSVNINPERKTAELLFVGIPTSEIKSPDALKAAVQAVLSARGKELTKLNVPVVCSSYAKTESK